MAIQTATEVLMALTEADTGPTKGTNMANLGEMYKYRHGRPALRQPAFDWKAQISI